MAQPSPPVSPYSDTEVSTPTAPTPESLPRTVLSALTELNQTTRTVPILPREAFKQILEELKLKGTEHDQIKEGAMLLSQKQDTYKGMADEVLGAGLLGSNAKCSAMVMETIFDIRKAFGESVLFDLLVIIGGAEFWASLPRYCSRRMRAEIAASRRAKAVKVGKERGQRHPKDTRVQASQRRGHTATRRSARLHQSRSNRGDK